MAAPWSVWGRIQPKKAPNAPVDPIRPYNCFTPGLGLCMGAGLARWEEESSDLVAWSDRHATNGARTLLVTPGITIRDKKLLSNKGHRY